MKRAATLALALAGAVAVGVAAYERGYKRGIRDWELAQAVASTSPEPPVDTESPLWQAMQRYGGLLMAQVGDGDWEAGLKNYERPPWRT